MMKDAVVMPHDLTHTGGQKRSRVIVWYLVIPSQYKPKVELDRRGSKIDKGTNSPYCSYMIQIVPSIKIQ
jgi:hypothetical protein